MFSDANDLSLILRRLDEIEHKLDRMRKELRMMQELQTPADARRTMVCATSA